MFTQHTNPFSKTSSKMFNMPNMPKVDYESVTSTCHQNIDALSQTHKNILDTMKSLSELQTNFARQAVESVCSFMKSMNNAKSVEEKVQVQSEAFKEGVNNAVAHSRNVTEHLTRSHQNIASKVGETVTENIKHAKETIRKASKVN